MLYQFGLTKELSFYEIAMPLLLGIRMDLAMAGYWLIIPGLALTASFFVRDIITQRIISISFFILATITCLLVTIDFELYHHWNFRMDTTPLFYVGSEGVGSVSIWVIAKLTLLFCIQFFAIRFAFQKYVAHKLYFSEGTVASAVYMFMVTGLLFFPIRSNIRVAPLNTGVVYFHKTRSFPNHAGINVVWNFMKSLVSDNALKYPNNFLDAQTTQQVFNDLMSSNDSIDYVLNLDRPNIILIIMESFTSKIIGPLGGQNNVTPNLNKLCSEGILFGSFYSSGDRTDKGIISILSGYPAQPKTSIIKYPNKTESLPSIPKVLSQHGYHTSFVYGGDIGFANMESYLNMAGFSNITEDDDFDLLLNTSKWGVHDEFVFDRLIHELDSASPPFFKVMLSLSSHEPFDAPFGKKDFADEEALFLNSCRYADSCIGHFIDESKKKDWWKNTLIIVTADHGHRNPGKSQVGESSKFKIPMLWLGGALNSSNRISKTGSQLDIAATLLTQIKLNDSQFTFSKNLLSSGTLPFAVYSFHNGFGYLDPQSEIIYDFDFNNYLKRDSSVSQESLVRGKAFMQMLFNDYNRR